MHRGNRLTETENTASLTLDDILRRLEAAKQSLIDALDAAAGTPFEAESSDGDSLRRAVERTVDDLNFYYGRLTARALNLPQPPCLTRAEFGSLREGTMSLQVAHRRFSNLLHDLVPGDLEKVAADAELGTFTLRQVLEMATGQYNMRAQQVQRLAAGGRPA
jgi:hypothetical protein